MKKLTLTLIIGFSGVALCAQEYTIQTISAKKEGSITPAFEKKVAQSALPSAKTKEGACNIVTVGRYETPKKAQSDLSKAKKIAKDAFVRPIERKMPKACETAVAAKEQKEKGAEHPINPVAAAKIESYATIHTAVQSVAVAAVSQPATVPETPKQQAASVAAAPVAHDAKAAPASPGTVFHHPTVVIYDKNSIRKNDILEAIEYYKNSPYHSFKPVALQR